MAARWCSSRWNLPFGLGLGIGSVAVGQLFTGILAVLFRLPASASGMIGLVSSLVVLCFVAIPTWRWFVNRRYKKRLAKQGVSGPLPTSYEIAPDQFVYRIGGVTRSARWEVLTEVFLAADWWVLMLQGEACYVPRRVFKSRSAEQSFVEAILQKLSDDARLRSPDVARFMNKAA